MLANLNLIRYHKVQLLADFPQFQLETILRPGLGAEGTKAIRDYNLTIICSQAATHDNTAL